MDARGQDVLRRVRLDASGVWTVQVSARRGAKCMLLSFVEAEGSPEPFYRRFGFVRTGEVVDGEHMMRLAF